MMLDAQIISISVGISFLSCIQAEIYFIPYPLPVTGRTVFDLSLTTTHGSVQISPVVFLDIENIGIAVGISLLSRIQTEIYVILYPFPLTGRHL